jgi:hypothetical protein
MMMDEEESEASVIGVGVEVWMDGCKVAST